MSRSCVWWINCINDPFFFLFLDSHPLPQDFAATLNKEAGQYLCPLILCLAIGLALDNGMLASTAQGVLKSICAAVHVLTLPPQLSA